nr:uncharacterized protein LOC124816505 [Hydra vulgaris]
MNEDSSSIDFEHVLNQDPNMLVKVSSPTAGSEVQQSFSTLTDVYAKIKEHEMLHTVHYVIAFKPTMEHNIDDIMKKNHKIYFESKDLPFTGVPFIFSSCSTFSSCTVSSCSIVNKEKTKV